MAMDGAHGASSGSRSPANPCGDGDVFTLYTPTPRCRNLRLRLSVIRRVTMAPCAYFPVKACTLDLYTYHRGGVA